MPFCEEEISVKQTLKMHRGSAVAAAVFMILSQLLNLAAARSSSATYTSPLLLINLLGGTLVTLMLSVILFRGKKDTAAGVVFLITILSPAFEVLYELFILLFATGTTVYVLLYLVSALMLVAFRGLLAGECLSKGKVSKSGGRMLLWLLPILCFCAMLLAQISLNLSNGTSIGGSVAESLIYVIPKWVGPLLMGIALFRPAARENAE